jgi:hypothetical protein
MLPTFLKTFKHSRLPGCCWATPTRRSRPRPAEARAIAREAYVWLPDAGQLPVQHAYFVDTVNKEYKGPWNKLVNTPRVYTPEDKAVQSPNSDTPYSMVALDLRAEPMVLTVPAVEKGRYYSIQLIDAYTYNFDYIGSRATGNGAGNYLVAGPGWKGDTPKGINRVIQSETQLVLGVYRTQLFNPADLDKVKKIQAGYKVQPLSVFLGTRPPPAVPAIAFVPALTPATQKTSLEFFNVLNFVLQFTPTVPSEKDLMADSPIGRRQQAVHPPSCRPGLAAIEQGMADAERPGGLAKRIDAKEGCRHMFGTRAHLKDNHLYRMTAAVLGIYGTQRRRRIRSYRRCGGPETDGGGAMPCVSRPASCRRSTPSGL